MQGYNAIVVFDETAATILLCKRRKNPYKGLYNFVGGKVEENEDGFHAAYRELEEETGITREDIHLTHLMDFTYPLDHCYLEVYVGKLNKPVQVHGDENTLLWSTLDKNFFDPTQYALSLIHISMPKRSRSSSRGISCILTPSTVIAPPLIS